MSSRVFLTSEEIAFHRQSGKEIGEHRVARGEVRALIEAANARALASQGALEDEAEELAAELRRSNTMAPCYTLNITGRGSIRARYERIDSIRTRAANDFVAAALMAEVTQ